jgi:molecular chaperone DnaK (HSP70)
VSVAYGIDFGTTNSVLARATAMGTEAIILDDQLPGEWEGTGFDKVLPSVIGFDLAGQPTFGWRAKTMEGAKLEAVKRLFATEDQVVIGSQKLDVETAAAIFFRHIQGRAAASGLMERLDRAVVTIPANSRGKARYRTKLSAGLAGIEVSALINEPTAAAMAHARAIGENQRILVFDWGGGTLDVTVLEAVNGVFIEETSKGIQRLGGIDLDLKFMETLLPRIPGSDGWRPLERDLFRLGLERAKIALSQGDAGYVALPRGGTLEVTRAQFVEAVAPLLNRTREPVETCLRESAGRIDHLVMVGGSSKIPAVQAMIADLVGAEPDARIDPMTAIAEGAAIADGILQGIITDLQFFVGTEHALGTVVHNPGDPAEGAFSVLIGRNTKYPAKASDAYLPGNDFQEKVDVEVIEGDPEKPIGHEDNVVLKSWTVTLPEKRLKLDAAFDITYLYDVDGILHVSAEDRRSGLVFMDEELSFGAAEDRSQLPKLRRDVDQLMAGDTRTARTAAPVPPSTQGLSAASRTAIRRAEDKVIPYVGDEDARVLRSLVARLQEAEPPEEEDCRTALERELRKHAYLL